MNAVAVAEVLSRYRFSYQCEEDLQSAIASVLDRSGVQFQREVELTKRDRVDFLVGTLGVEVKVKGSPTQVARQLSRYAESEVIEELLLVTSRAVHRTLPSELNRKPIKVLYLNPLAG